MTVYEPPWPPEFRTINWRLRANTGLYVSPLTKRMQGVSRAGDLWECDIDLPALEDAKHRDWRGTLATLASRFEPIYLSDYMNGRPKAYPTGSAWGAPIVNGGSQTGRSLITDGWAAGATMFMGDYIAFENGTFRELHMLEVPVTANGGGQATLTLTPPIRRSPADNATILLDGQNSVAASRCAGEFLIVPGVVGWSSDPAYREINGFSAVEFLR